MMRIEDNNIPPKIRALFNILYKLILMLILYTRDFFIQIFFSK